jgi:putative addiction module component (TIGR02574 family)
MSETATKLLEQLLTLPEADRLMIADQLWESLGEEKQQELIDEATSDPEYQAELERRLESVENGSAKLVSWEEARADIQAELERRRAARKQENPK